MVPPPSSGSTPAPIVTKRVFALFAMAVLLLAIGVLLSVIWIFVKRDDAFATSFSVVTTFICTVLTIYSVSTNVQRLIGKVLSTPVQPKPIIVIVTIVLI